MMKAAVVREFGKPLDICEVERPSLADSGIIVKVAASGVCHTDLHAAQGDWPVKPSPPFIPGHEGVGTVAEVQAGGGAEGVLVTAVAGKSFEQGVGMLARGGTMSLVGLPPESFPLEIFDTVLNAKTIRGSIVGTRNDLAEALQFAAEGKVAAHYSTESLDDVNSIFDRMKKGAIDGRIVMEL